MNERYKGILCEAVAAALGIGGAFILVSGAIMPLINAGALTSKGVAAA
jgi:hypothetical protein